MYRNTQSFFFLTVALLSACSAAHSPTQSNADNPAAAVDPSRIEVKEDLARRLTLGHVERRPVTERIEVAGRVEADNTRLVRVGSPVRGRITKLLVLEGERVRQGQPLAVVYSTDLSDAQFGFLKARSQVQLAERSEARGAQLLDAGVIGEAEMQRRQAERLQASVELSALRQQLEALGMSDEAVGALESTRKLNSEYRIVASANGTVLERTITAGQIVQPAEVAFTIADLSQVWLVADVPEQASGDLKHGESVKAQIAAYQDEVIAGRLAFVSSTVSPETRTVRVRMNVPNPQGRYKPAMLANMTLTKAAGIRRTVPASAVVREGDKENVFVQTGPHSFTLRQCTLGAEGAELRVVMDGIDDDDTLVLDGAFHLNNERKRLAAGGGA